VLLPGRWDVHAHLVQWAAARQQLGLHSARIRAMPVAATLVAGRWTHRLL